MNSAGFKVMAVFDRTFQPHSGPELESGISDFEPENTKYKTGLSSQSCSYTSVGLRGAELRCAE
ncbi:MAG: hypothetical protein ACLFN5_06065, partial [bacterium]